MNEAEKRILHGLWYDQRQAGKGVYQADELMWLALCRCPRSRRRWEKPGMQGAYNTIQTTMDDYHPKLGVVTAAAFRLLQHLEGYEFVIFSRNGSTFNIAVTTAGDRMGEELDTWWGRWNISYKQNKDGLLGLLVTIGVSIVTAAITAFITVSGL